eukprot:2461194-Pyramimonas_sp.AAC.1
MRTTLGSGGALASRPLLRSSSGDLQQGPDRRKPGTRNPIPRPQGVHGFLAWARRALNRRIVDAQESLG